MNKSILSAGLAIMLVATSPISMASHGQPKSGWYRDTAKVIDVEPIVRVIRIEEPEKICKKRKRHRHDEAEYSPASLIIGGIVGGLVGNQVGNGHGNDAATIAGTLLGAAIGDNLGKDRVQYAHHKSYKRCKTVTRVRQKEVVDAYRVTYRYHGRKYVTEMDHRPGRRIKVEAMVKPLKRQYGKAKQGKGGYGGSRDQRHYW